MTAYLVNHRKKIEIFERREAELLHAIKNSYSKEKINSVAEKVRYAKLKVFKAKYAKGKILPPSTYKPEGEALVWENLTIEEIIQKYVHVKT